MNYFLAKTDPETYSVDDLEKDRTTVWDGVRNPQALRAIREMRPGDKVFVYHSQGEAAILGRNQRDGIVLVVHELRGGQVSGAAKLGGRHRQRRSAFDGLRHRDLFNRGCAAPMNSSPI